VHHAPMQQLARDGSGKWHEILQANANEFAVETSVEECAVHETRQPYFYLSEHATLLVGGVIPPGGDFVQGAEATVAELGLRVDDADADAGGGRIAGRGCGVGGHDGSRGKVAVSMAA
jgi:hypothetical protein